MKINQNFMELSVDGEQKNFTAMHFNIQLDLGNLFVPGKQVSRKQYSILYCRSNCGAEFFVGSEHYRLHRGDILQIKPNVPHGVISYGKDNEAYFGFLVTISDEYVEYILNQMGKRLDYREHDILIHTRGTLWENIDSLFAKILEEYTMKAPGWEAIIFGSSMILMIQISRAADSNSNASARVDKADLLNGILYYVENNLSEKITLEDVASRFFVSSSTVTHLFNKKMNISFYKYVMNYRLWKAKNLIQEGIPMEKIATQVGFNDYSAFYRAFKQEFQMSPRQYYKQSLENGRE